MKRVISSVICFMLLMPSAAYAVGQQAPFQIDSSDSSRGIVSVQYEGQRESDKKIKVMVEKDSSKYYYTLSSAKQAESFPLQLGSGTYQVAVLENTSGNSYRPVLSSSIQARLTDEKETFLQSVQAIEWDDSMAAIKKAGELTKDLDSDTEKIKAIYEYVVQNVSYDYSKIENMPVDYLPDVEATYNSGKGICYDFASLLAAMLRSAGVPAKLVKGYSQNAIGYHAWNEVYVNNKWVVVDTSYDAQIKASGGICSMIKAADLYNKVYEY